MGEIENGQHWRHKKRGSVYEIIDADASIQVASLGEDLEDHLESEIWVAYRPVNGHKLFFRMREEFLDGRFEQVFNASTAHRRMQMWFKLSGDSRLGSCATEGCGGQPTCRLEADGVGSNYCSGCKEKIDGVHLPRCDCGHLFEICDAPNCP